MQSRKIYCDWFKLNPGIIVTRKLPECDCLIIGSPHGVEYLDAPVEKKFLFCQMREDLFKPHDPVWVSMCNKFYLAPFPMFAISEWNIDYFLSIGRKQETIYINNGINFDHFPIEVKEKDGKTILIEGLGNKNPSKDPDQVALKVALRLADDGYKITSYSAFPFLNKQIQHFVKPSLKVMNQLYSDATILLKASIYDARSCSPIEAMTKGTVTARAINQGDDDLGNNINCVRCKYDEDELYLSAKALLLLKADREYLSNNCIEYVKQYCKWDTWIHIINDRICQE